MKCEVIKCFVKVIFLFIFYEVEVIVLRGLVLKDDQILEIV